MLLTTTNSVEGRRIIQYYGIVSGEAIIGANVFRDFFAGIPMEQLHSIMEQNRVALNASLPAYSQITKVKILTEEFEKTPKKSIKRFLYQVKE